MAAKKQQSFEEAITRLEEIADILENGSPALSEALTLYSEGAELLKMCSKSLEDAQSKITGLTKEKSQPQE